jgi:uncharacterized spore protein YtfJ
MEKELSTNTAPLIEPIEQMIARLGADAVFGTPAIKSETVVIPVAQVSFNFGYGSGYGRNASRAVSQADGVPDEGGGAMGRVIPIGYIRISPTGNPAAPEVKYEPVIDATRIPLAGIFMIAWSVFWITVTIRSLANIIAQRRRT